SSEIGLGFFQETHPDRLFSECSHYSEMISSPQQMPRLLQTAIQHAVGRSGVRVVSVPGDIADQPAPEQAVETALVTSRPPVGHALRGKEWIQYDNPFDVGMSGLLGYGAAYEATHECDLLILLGTDFPYNAFLPDDVPIVQVDVRPEVLGRRSKLDLAVWG